MKRLTTFGTNEQIRQMLDEALARDGASAKGRSHWLCRAVQSLLADDPNLLKVGLGEGLERFPLRDICTLDAETSVLIENASRRLLMVDPSRGAQASILRAAIRHGAKNPITMTRHQRNSIPSDQEDLRQALSRPFSGIRRKSTKKS